MEATTPQIRADEITGPCRHTSENEGNNIAPKIGKQLASEIHTDETGLRHTSENVGDKVASKSNSSITEEYSKKQAASPLFQIDNEYKGTIH